MKRIIAIMILFIIPVSGCKSLNEAAMKGDSSRVKDLISRGADINAQDKDGRTALMYASQNGQAGIVRMLVEAKADVNARDKDGATALMFAAESNSLDVVQCLIANNADVEAEDNSGSIALYRSKKKSKVREELLKNSVKYRAGFLCRINTLFKYLEKRPEITVSYVGRPEDGIGAVYYGDGVRLERQEGILPEMIEILKKYGVVITGDLYKEFDKCGKDGKRK